MGQLEVQRELFDDLPTLIVNSYAAPYSIDAVSNDYCGGLFTKCEPGWGFDRDKRLLHYYGYMDSIAACGRAGRPAEMYAEGLEELYHDQTETWYDAEYCPECMGAKAAPSSN